MSLLALRASRALGAKIENSHSRLGVRASPRARSHASIEPSYPGSRRASSSSTSYPGTLVWNQHTQVAGTSVPMALVGETQSNHTPQWEQVALPQPPPPPPPR